MTKVVLPSFSQDEFAPYEMRQLVSALELRFQALEEDNLSLFVTEEDDFQGLFAPIGHTHSESEVTDLQDYLLNLNEESIFDLIDVTGAPSHNDILVYNVGTSSFQSVAPGASAALPLNDLSNVFVPNPNDSDVLTFEAITNRWIALPPDEAGIGGNTLFGLDDTDLAGQGQFDLLFNATGLGWENTNGLKWNSGNQYLQLANSHSINWLNATGDVSTPLLNFTGIGTVVGDPSNYARVEDLVSSDTTSTTYVDTANGLDQVQTIFGDGDEIMLVSNALIYTSVNASNSNCFKVIANGVDVVGSEQSNEVYNVTGPVTQGSPYGFTGWFTANTSGTNVISQHKRGASTTENRTTSETHLLFNLTASAPNHVKGRSTVSQDITGPSWVSSTVSVSVGAGDYLIFMCFNSTPGRSGTSANEGGINANDGNGDIALCGRVTLDTNTDIMVMSGSYVLRDYAGGVINVIHRTTGNSSQCDYRSIVVIPLSDFNWWRASQLDGTDRFLAAQNTEEVINSISVSSMPSTSSYLAIAGINCQWVGNSTNTAHEILENVNSGGDTVVGWDISRRQRQGTAVDLYEGSTIASYTLNYAQGDQVDIKQNAENINAGFATQAQRHEMLCLIETQDATVISSGEFIAGDPGFVTRIDGTQIDIANNVGINWEDGAGDPIEMVILEGTPDILGDPIEAYVFQTFTNSTNATASYIDAPNGLDVAQSTFTEGDEIMIVSYALVFNNNDSFQPNNGIRLVYDDVEMVGSEQLMEGTGNQGSRGDPYMHVGWFTAGASGNVNIQLKIGGGSGVYNITGENHFLLNLTQLPNHAKAQNTTPLAITGTGWTDLVNSISIAAGDWLIYCGAKTDIPVGTSNVMLAVFDGTTTHYMASRTIQDNQDELTYGGAILLEDFAGGTVSCRGRTAGNGSTIEYVSIIAIPLSDFENSYTVQAGLTDVFTSAQSVPEVFNTISVASIPDTANYLALTWGAVTADNSYAVEMNEDVNGAGDATIAWSEFSYPASVPAAIIEYRQQTVAGKALRAYSTGDAVEFTQLVTNHSAAYASEGFHSHGLALIQMNGPSTPGDDQFTVGDPAFPTRIDGTQIDLAKTVGINWEDDAGDPQELLAIGVTQGADWPALTEFTYQQNTEFTTLSSAGILFNDDGTRAYVVSDETAGNSFLRINDPDWSVGYVPEDESAPTSVYTRTTSSMRDARWNSDGTSMFVAWLDDDTIEEIQNDGTPFNPVNGDLVTVIKSFAIDSPRCLDRKPDGTKMWYISVTDGDIHEVNLSVADDLDTASEGGTYSPAAGTMRAMKFSPGGSTFLALGTDEVLYEYSVSVQWDITTASATGNSIDMSAYSTGGATPMNFDLSPDGSSMVVVQFQSVTDTENELSHFTSPGSSGGGGADAFVIGDSQLSTVIDGLGTQITGSSTEIFGTLSVGGDTEISGDFDIFDGSTWRIYDSDNDDFLQIVHDGTEVEFTTAGTDAGAVPIQLKPGSGNWVGIGGGGSNSIPLRILDGAETSYSDFFHDATDFETAFTGTGDWTISGLTGKFIMQAAVESYDVSTTERARFESSGIAAFPRTTFFIGSDDGDAITNAGMWIKPDVTAGTAKDVSIEVIDRSDVTATTNRFGFRIESAVAKFASSTDTGGAAGLPIGITTQGITSTDYDIFIDESTRDVTIGTLPFDGDQTVGAGQDGHVLTYSDGTGLITLAVTGVAGQTPWASDIDGAGFGLDNIDRLEIQAPGVPGDSLTMTHDDTDFNFVFANTADWNITGLTAINAGTIDADFDALTATTFNAIALTTGGAATDYLDGEGNYTEPPSGAPGGSSTEIQYNTGGAFDATSGLYWTNASNRLSITDDATGTLRLSVASNVATFEANNLERFDFNPGIIRITNSGGNMQFPVTASDPAGISGFGILFGDGNLWSDTYPAWINEAGEKFGLADFDNKQYYFQTSTAASDPAVGGFRFDNATPASVTNLYIDDLGQNNRNQHKWLSQLNDGDLVRITDGGDENKWWMGTVNGSTTDNGGWWTVPVTYISANTLFTGSTACQFDIQFLSLAPGGGASELSDLTDVNTSTPTDQFVLVADGVDFESRLLVQADISDITALTAEVNLLDLAGMTAGDVLSADTATTASWKAQAAASITATGSPLVNQVAIWADSGTQLDSNLNFTYTGTLVTIGNAATLAMGTTTGDRLMIYGPASSASSYGLGIESSCLYYKSNGVHRWYSAQNADSGSGDIMELSGAGALTLGSGITASGTIANRATNNIIETRYITCGNNDGDGIYFESEVPDDGDSYGIWTSAQATADLGGRLDTNSDWNMYFGMREAGGGTNRGYQFHFDEAAYGGINFAISPDAVRQTMPLLFQEVASDITSDLATWGQLWCKDDAPNTIWWTNDAGGQYLLNESSSTTVGLTADVSSIQGGGVIAAIYNVYSTVANTGDAATLPATSLVGDKVYIKNDGANSMDVFPASGDDAGAGTDTAVAVANGVGAMFMATSANATWTQMY